MAESLLRNGEECREWNELRNGMEELRIADEYREWKGMNDVDIDNGREWLGMEEE